MSNSNEKSLNYVTLKDVQDGFPTLQPMGVRIKTDDDDTAKKGILSIDPRVDPQAVIDYMREHPLTEPYMAYVNGKTIVTMFMSTMRDLYYEEFTKQRRTLDGFIYSIDAASVKTNYQAANGYDSAITYKRPTENDNAQYKILAYKDKVLILPLNEPNNTTVLKCEHYVIYETQS